MLDDDLQAQAGTIDSLKTALASSDGRVATLEATVKELQAAVAGLQTPPTLDTLVVKACATSSDCTPTIEGDGADVAVNAPGGRVVFSSNACDETDLCDLAAQVKSLMRKFGADVDDDY